jgi:hypothetical protein
MAPGEQLGHQLLRNGPGFDKPGEQAFPEKRHEPLAVPLGPLVPSIQGRLVEGAPHPRIHHHAPVSFPLTHVEREEEGEEPRRRPGSMAGLDLLSRERRGHVTAAYASRRPLRKLKARTTSAATSSRWIRPPPTLKLKPRSHSTASTTTIVHSMVFAFLENGAPPTSAGR